MIEKINFQPLLLVIVFLTGPIAGQTINESSLPRELTADTMLISSQVMVETDVAADLIIDILGQGDFYWHGGTRVSIPAGTSIVNFNLPILYPFSNDTDAFWNLLLTEPGTDWRSPFARGSRSSIQITQSAANTAVTTTSMNILAPPSIVTPNNTYTINLAYESEQNATLNLQIESEDGTLITEGSTDVDAGKGVTFISVTFPEDASGAFSYQSEIVSEETNEVLSIAPIKNGTISTNSSYRHSVDLNDVKIADGEDLPFFYHVTSEDNLEVVYNFFDMSNGGRWAAGGRVATSGSSHTNFRDIRIEDLAPGAYEISTFLVLPGKTWRDALDWGRRIPFEVVAPIQPDLKAGELTFRQSWLPLYGFDDGLTLDRRAVVGLPTKQGITAEKHPVTILLHGSGGNAEQMMFWHRYLTTHILIGCQGFRNDWNISFDATQAPDVDFIRRLIYELRTYENVDTENITILGYSNGSSMIHRLMIELEEGLFQNGIGMASQLRHIQYNNNQFWNDPNGLWDYTDPIVPAGDRRFLYLHGEKDELLDVEGNVLFDPSIDIFMPVLDSMFALSKAMGGDDTNRLTMDDAIVDDEGYSFVYIDDRVEYYLIKNADHGMSTPDRFGSRMVEKIAEFLDVVPWER